MNAVIYVTLKNLKDTSFYDYTSIVYKIRSLWYQYNQNSY